MKIFIIASIIAIVTAKNYDSSQNDTLNSATILSRYKKNTLQGSHHVPQQEIKTHEVPVPVLIPYEVLKRIEVPTERLEPYIIEKKVPIIVEKPYPVTVEKPFPVSIPKAYPVHVPVYRHVFHHQNKDGWKNQ